MFTMDGLRRILGLSSAREPQAPPRILGLTRVRNEQEILGQTLDSWSSLCSGGIYVYDDASTDGTVRLCSGHPAVRGVVQGSGWDADRERAEWMNRQAVLERARQEAGKDDWFAYFDADEYPFFDRWELFQDRRIKGIRCRLYDVYITPEDVDAPYLERDFVGPEYRTILFFFRNSPALSYDTPDQREAHLPRDSRKVVTAGTIKHFGKGVSLAHWEATCDYYIQHFPKYAQKWAQRKGKGLKADYRSDFGNPLIRFSEVLAGTATGFPLETMPYGKN